MLKTILTRTVDFCTRHPWPVIVVAVVVAILSSIYSVQNFAINTQVEKLISDDLPWKRHEAAIQAAFPQRDELILVVVQASTPENVQQAANLLAERIAAQRDLIRSVHQPGGTEFFARNGQLYSPVGEVEERMTKLMSANSLLNALAVDPSLRGIMDGLSFGSMGVQAGHLKLDDLTWPLTRAADTLDLILAGKPASFSWRVLAKGQPAELRELRRIIEVHPIVDYSKLESGKPATDAIRKAAADLNLASQFGATVRLTGPVPLADDEFSTLRTGAPIDVLITVVAVLIILLMALRWSRIIVAVFISLAVGFAATAALGLFLAGALNPISVAFAVLFIGLGVDFGIQFSVRYREERHDHEHDDLRGALRNTASTVGAQLTLAAAAVTAAFFSFWPTEYRGLSELGLIAGTGMVVAYITSVTLLPALLGLFTPPPEPRPLGFAWLAPVDRFMERHRVGIVALTVLVALAGAPLLFYLRFDFNPQNLRNPEMESARTIEELKRDRDMGINSIEILAASLDEANAKKERLAKLPEVSQAITLSDFVPQHQDRKLAAIRRTAQALHAPLNPERIMPPPSDAENVHALETEAQALRQIANEEKGPGPEAARRLAALLSRLAKGTAELRQRAEEALIPPLKVALTDLRTALTAERVTLDSLPNGLRRDWITADGRARVELRPKGDPVNNEVMREFGESVLKVEPTATGAPVVLLEAGRTIVHAFFEAGFWALLSITILLWITLRRFGDVLLTLVPLLLAGVITLEVCVLIGMPLNFANIIALPLLLGIGVAFKIYYIMAWRAGGTNLLQSPLTRAVFFSALTGATAFGSLWMSSHPGTSSMGKLLALSLICTMMAAVLFQPALMGPPRDIPSKAARRRLR
jgi:hopanoid biosynthesis associated RND transporter like protein HpnN